MSGGTPRAKRHRMSQNAKAAAPPVRLVFDGRVLAIQVLLAASISVAIGLQVMKATSPDFAAFWAAHHVALPYNSAVLSKATGPRTMFFPYPPTFLFMTLPLAWVPMQAGYLSWVALSTAGLVASMRRLSAPLLLATPAVFMAEVGGQTSLIMGALVFLGATLRQRPLLAGALFGVAACIKPQAVVLLPLVLLAAGQWRMLMGAAASGLSLSLAATLVYGPGVWSDWLGSLPAFLAANDKAWTGRYLALPGLWKFAALAAGAAAAAYAGRRGQLELGTFIAVAAAMLSSLHTMDYDAAILAPFAVSAALSNRWSGIFYAAGIAFPPSAPTVLALAGFATWSLVQGSRLLTLGQQALSKQNGNML